MIVGVSVKFIGDVEFRLPRPNRHADCFKVAMDQGFKATDCIGSHGQGFYTDKGAYLNRKEAMTHVRAVGQEILADPKDNHVNQSSVLVSEDLWLDESK